MNEKIIFDENNEKLLIRESEGRMDVIFVKTIDTDLKKEVKIKLLTSYFQSKINIEDLQGNGYKSKFQDRGFGTLLVNTAICEFKNKYDENTIVYGRLSNVGDPIERDKADICDKRRKYFWTSFGFELDNRTLKIEAKLKDLRLKSKHSQKES